MNALAPKLLDDLLSEAAEVNGLQGQLRVRLNNAEHIPYGRIGIETQDEVGCG
jgi:hypothetical protein